MSVDYSWWYNIIRKNVPNVIFVSVIEYKGELEVHVRVKENNVTSKLRYKIEHDLDKQAWGWILEDLRNKNYEKEKQEHGTDLSKPVEE